MLKTRKKKETRKIWKIKKLNQKAKVKKNQNYNFKKLVKLVKKGESLTKLKKKKKRVWIKKQQQNIFLLKKIF